MKKILLTAACLSLASPAAAVTINNLYMKFYDTSRNLANTTGAHTTVTGSLNTTASSGHMVGNVPFAGHVWSADEVWVSTTTGKNTWSGIRYVDYYNDFGYFNYTFTLAPGDVAFGLYFDWSVNDNIPVLAVMHPEADGSWSPVDQVWYNGSKTTSKTGMQTSPFPGQWPAFYTVAVPEPASALLIGSGLAGLVGLAGRRRSGH